ncbi:MAG: hypothetical protein J7M38_10805 [Armatimonadetes bacterium]|nr:hypothetical protein [Armatimonadota bacterium]
MRTEIQAGELKAIIGDNEPCDGQRAGYNGVHSLTSVHCPDNLFVDGIAGLNLEHLLDGRDMPESEKFFEPRHQPMELEALDARTVQLHLAATPTLRTQVLTTFRLMPPHYLDAEFRVVLREPVLTHGYLLCFWASYINAPEDPAMYFLGRPRDETMGEGWQRLCTRAHNDHSTVCHVNVQPQLRHSMTSRDCLACNYADVGFTRPFFYGRRANMVFALMFDLTEEVRLTHSPSGGGRSGQRFNPAWDFQLVIPECRVGHEYVLRARAVYKPWVDARDILQEFERWDPLLVE